VKYLIKTQYFYHSGTCHAPSDAYVTLQRAYAEEVAVFDLPQDAAAFLLCPSFGNLGHDGGGVYSHDGPYIANHGEYAAPTYTIVNAASGRSNASIRAVFEDANQ